jgi:hypothetical protein
MSQDSRERAVQLNVRSRGIRSREGGNVMKGKKAKNDLSRRDFIKTTAVGVGATALTGLGAKEARATALPESWDYEADIVVLGFGFAGQAVAIEARDAGASVLVLEKAPRKHWGGSSAANNNLDSCSIGRNVEVAIEYLRSECWGTVEDEDLIRDHVLANHELPAWIESLGGKVVWTPRVPTYPLIPGGENWGGTAEQHNSFIGYPPAEYLQKYPDGSGKAPWQEWMNDLAEARGIKILGDTPATELIQDVATKEILGVKALTGVTTTADFHYTGGRGITVKAKKAVVLACGGYENNPEILHNFSPHPHSAFVTMYGSPYSTGDGLIMAANVGAKLWHMNKKEAHNMASTVASKELGVGRTVNAWATSIAKGPGIIVNRDGQRFHNEYHNSGHSDDRREWDRFEHKLLPTDDYNFSDYRNCPFFWIFDDTTMKAGALGGSSQFAGVFNIWRWTKDNLAELAKGWFIKADTVEALGKMIEVRDFFGRVVGMNAAGLVETVNKYNQYCAGGKDLDFGRRPSTLTPLVTPPFYAMEVCECQTNTDGGPKHNRYNQVLNNFDQPIPRLYAVGELGSIFGALYNGAENIPECCSSGRRAAKHAVTLQSWD